MTDPLEWRAVLAALANADTRSVFAEVVGVSELSMRSRERVMARLVASGLVELADDGRPVVAEDRLRASLRQSASPRAVGAERFLARDGRIIDYPARTADREDVLRLVASRALVPGESLTEQQLGGRLRVFTDDVATLRRYLVEAGLISRLPDGTSYRLDS